MSYTGKNPKFDSTILKDEGVSAVGNPAASSHKIVNRSGKLWTKNSTGQELPLVTVAYADDAAIKAIAATSRNDGDIAWRLDLNSLYVFDSASAATNDDDFVLQPDAGTGRWLKATQIAGSKAGQFDNISPNTTKGDLIGHDGANNIRLAVGSDGLALIADSTTSSGLRWSSASSGSGEVNYISNADAEANTTGWATYADAAGSTPVDGTGGSPTVTWTRQNTVVLRGNQTFKLTKDAANRQGEGVSYDFSIKEQDVSKKLKIQFDFKTNEDAAYASGDLTVYIYDVTNTTLITPVDTDIIDGQNIFTTSFNSTTSTSYRLIFHIATTNASAWDAYIDNVIVGPGMASQGAAIGAMASATTSVSNYNNATGLSAIPGEFQWQRLGSDLLVNINFYVAGTGTDASELQFDTSTVSNFPSNITFTTGKYGTGVIRRDNSTQTSRNTEAGILVCDGTANIMFSESVDLNNLNGNQFGSTGTLFDVVNITAILPVVQWQGSGIIPMLSEDNLSEPASYTPTSQGFGTITSRLEWHREGKYCIIQGDFTAGTTTATEAQIGLPNGYTVALQTSNSVLVGMCYRSTANDSNNPVLATDGDTYLNFSRVNSAGGFDPLVPQNGNTVVGAGQRVSFYAKVPVVEFAGSQNSLVGYSEATPDYKGLVSMNSGATTSVVGEYETTSKAADNNFTAGTFTITRIGNTVTITTDVALTWSSASTAETTSGFIPSTYRPSGEVRLCMNMDSGGVRMLQVETDGTIGIQYRNWTGGLTATTTSSRPVTISYVIT